MSRCLAPFVAWIVLIASILAQTSPASATVFRFRQVAVELGYGTGIENTKLFRIDSQWDFLPQLYKGGEVELVGIGQLSSGVWKGDHRLFNLSATPIYRLQHCAGSANVRPYFESGIGFHFISEIQMRHRMFSTYFQFGNHLGVGVLVGRTRVFDISYQFQHLSNASIRKPNSGINFHIVRVGCSI